MGSAFAGRVRATARRAGVSLPETNDPDGAEELLDLEGTDEPWFALGSATELSLSPTRRARAAAHFTPVWLARRIVERTVDAGTGSIVDPSCGAGVFLLAALERLTYCGVEPRDALTRVTGFDIDANSLAVADAAVRWWAHAHGVADPAIDLRSQDPLVAGGEQWEVVVGNPPFLDQLDADSAMRPSRRAELQRRLGDVVGAYTDEALLFLAWAVRASEPSGRIAMVLPRSVLASRDAERARALVHEKAHLDWIWFDDSDTFSAGVRVCVVGLGIGRARDARTVSVLYGNELGVLGEADPPGPSTWAPLLATAAGVPEVRLSGRPRLASMCEVVAGFRSEYYGLVDAVAEGHSPSPAAPALITSGAIDLAETRWGVSPIRFAKRSWTRPVVDRAAVTDQRVAAWLSRLLRPKVLIATQTRVVEAVADPSGTTVGSVPVLNLVPNDPEDVWLVAAASSAPPVTAWALRLRAGTALSADAIKLSVGDLRELPLPGNDTAWHEGADLFRRAQNTLNRDVRYQLLREFGERMTVAYGCGPDVLDWWDERRIRSMPDR